MSDLSDLQLLEEGPEVAAEMPEERGARLPLLQPQLGVTFQLPTKFDFEPMQTDSGQRVMALFRDASVLRTYPAGIAVRTIVNNLETTRKDDAGVEQKVNPLAYLLRALGFKGPLKVNKDYAVALSQFPAHYFIGDWVWTANCNKKRDIYRDGGQIKGRSGCGQKYGLKGRTYKDREGAVKRIIGIPKDTEQLFIETFRCLGKRADESQCDAELFVNGEVSNFRAIPTETEGGQS